MQKQKRSALIKFLACVLAVVIGTAVLGSMTAGQSAGGEGMEGHFDRGQMKGQAQGAFGLHNLSMAAGHLCFLLLSLSMAAGLLHHMHWLGNKHNWWLDEIHQWAGAWTVYTGLVHGLLLHYGGKSMSWTSILLPVVTGGGERGLPLALGIYGLYAFAAVTVSGYMLGAIKGYLWRWLHWLSFPAWALSLAHVLLFSHRFQTWALHKERAPSNA